MLVAVRKELRDLFSAAIKKKDRGEDIGPLLGALPTSVALTALTAALFFYLGRASTK